MNVKPFFAHRLFSLKRLSLLTMLISLTLLFIGAQLLFSYVHFKTSGLMDALVGESVLIQIMYPAVLLPIITFLLLQIAAYILLVAWIWFITTSLATWLHWSQVGAYFRGLLLWLTAAIAIIALNTYYYPDSFFALSGASMQWALPYIGYFCLLLLTVATLLAFYPFFFFQQYSKTGWIIASVIMLSAVAWGYTTLLPNVYNHVALKNSAASTQAPNIIFIGLDSLRPDFVGYFHQNPVSTRHLDAFLKTASVFTNVYTPLARTFPSWVGMLTGKHPKNSGARNNLINPALVLQVNPMTLATRLKDAGYTTIYASDEKRFSNILKGYGFDRVVGPTMGADDFLIGGLSDYPLTNLLVNLPIGRFLFPYNYGNRAAAITYRPKSFLMLLNNTIPAQSNKPVFAAIHLCLSHWPYTWSGDHQSRDMSNVDRYVSSIKGVDQEWQQVFNLLQHKGLLNHAIVVVLSDHGTALGLYGDRIIKKENYVGTKDNYHLVSTYRLSGTTLSTPADKANSISTSFGQGTDVLSFSQYHPLLAFKGYGVNLPQKTINSRESLLNLTPTILDLLHLQPLPDIDGHSMVTALLTGKDKESHSTPLYLETGDKFGAIEKEDISVEKVLQARIGAYVVQHDSGLLYLTPGVEESLIQNKQLSVWEGDWLLARFPKRIGTKVSNKVKNGLLQYDIPAYYVLVNTNTGKWTVGLNSSLAKKAPTAHLLALLQQFYGDEVGKVLK